MGTAFDLNVKPSMKNRSLGKQINVRLTENEEKNLTLVINQLQYQSVTDAVRDMLRNVYLETQDLPSDEIREIVKSLPVDDTTKKTQINMRLNAREAQMSDELKDKFAGYSVSDVIRTLISLYHKTATTKKYQRRVVV